MFNKLIKNPSEKLKSQLFMNLMFAFEKPSSITRCSIRVMLIERDLAYYGSRGKIIGRAGHYGDIIPLGLKVYFLLVVAMTVPLR